MTDDTTPVRPPQVWSRPQAHLTAALSHPWYITISRLSAIIVRATSDFYHARDIWPALLPVTCGSISSPIGLGSDSVAVPIELHGATTYLADSMQFQLEAILRHGYCGVYYIMPTFRGEDHDATHLNQFFHSEAEICGGLEDVMELIEKYVLHLIDAILADRVVGQVQAIAGTVDHLEKLSRRRTFHRLTHAEAHAILGDRGMARLGDDFMVSRTGERELIQRFGDGVWLTDPPRIAAPFYQGTTDQGTATAADLLLSWGTEVAGCGARHCTGEDVRTALSDHHIAPADYEWYVRMKAERPMNTAGFGLGIERLLMWILLHDDIRDLQVMPRLKGVPSWL